MIIISQDGDKITNNINLKIRMIYNPIQEQNKYYIIKDDDLFGEYDTKERCKEIIEQIAMRGEKKRFYKMPRR